MIPLAFKFLVAFHRKGFEWILLERVAFIDKSRKAAMREKKDSTNRYKGLQTLGSSWVLFAFFVNMMLASCFHAGRELMQSLWYVLPNSSAEKQTEVAISNESTTPCWNDSKQWINNLLGHHWICDSCVMWIPALKMKHQSASILLSGKGMKSRNQRTKSNTPSGKKV